MDLEKKQKLEYTMDMIIQQLKFFENYDKTSFPGSIQKYQIYNLYYMLRELEKLLDAQLSELRESLIDISGIDYGYYANTFDSLNNKTGLDITSSYLLKPITDETIKECLESFKYISVNYENIQIGHNEVVCVPEDEIRRRDDLFIEILVDEETKNKTYPNYKITKTDYKNQDQEITRLVECDSQVLETIDNILHIYNVQYIPCGVQCYLDAVINKLWELRDFGTKDYRDWGGYDWEPETIDEIIGRYADSDDGKLTIKQLYYEIDLQTKNKNADKLNILNDIYIQKQILLNQNEIGNYYLNHDKEEIFDAYHISCIIKREGLTKRDLDSFFRCYLQCQHVKMLIDYSYYVQPAILNGQDYSKLFPDLGTLTLMNELAQRLEYLYDRYQLLNGIHAYGYSGLLYALVDLHLTTSETSIGAVFTRWLKDNMEPLVNVEQKQITNAYSSSSFQLINPNHLNYNSKPQLFWYNEIKDIYYLSYYVLGEMFKQHPEDDKIYVMAKKYFEDNGYKDKDNNYEIKDRVPILTVINPQIRHFFLK